METCLFPVDYEKYDVIGKLGLRNYYSQLDCWKNSKHEKPFSINPINASVAII